jgi:ribosomal protein S18 acetylase RimI-like enzyme
VTSAAGADPPAQEDGEAAVANFAVHAGWVHARTPGMRLLDREDLTLADSGLPSDTFNVIFRARLDPAGAPARIREAVEHFRAARRPFSWWVFPSDRPRDLCDALRSAGLDRAETEMAMRADLTALPSADPEPESLRVERVATRRSLKDFARITAANATPPDAHVLRFYELAAPALLSEGCPLRLWIGYVGDAAVSTAECAIGGEAVGLSNVSTRIAYRRRGFAAALIRRILEEARGEGFPAAFLQAAPGAVSLYERLGFRTHGTIEEYKDAGPRP